MDTTPYDVLAQNCPTREVFGRLGERWVTLIIVALQAGPVRFNELRRSVQGVTPKMLTQTLRAMERDGLITRSVTPTVPVTVEYALAPLGEELSVPVLALRDWAYQHMSQIEAAREAYDTTAIVRSDS